MLGLGFCIADLGFRILDLESWILGFGLGQLQLGRLGEPPAGRRGNLGGYVRLPFL